MQTPVAILVSDLHFSTTAPAARSGEPDWFAAMADRLQWLAELQDIYGGVPIIAAGDIWDRYLQPPGTINWIVDHCPQMYAIPGQHDLASHVYANRETSAYGTLVRAGTLIDLVPGEFLPLGNKFYVNAFPWGADIDVEVKPREGTIVIAACHRYVHNGGHTAHMHATDQQSAASLPGLRGYHVCHFGDNHVPFEYLAQSGQLVINTGGFYRRVADQQHHTPGAVVLFRDTLRPNGVSYKRECYNTADESFSRDHLALAKVSQAEAHASVDGFIARLLEGGVHEVTDFREYVRHYAGQGDLSPMVADLLRQSVE